MTSDGTCYLNPFLLTGEEEAIKMIQEVSNIMLGYNTAIFNQYITAF